MTVHASNSMYQSGVQVFIPAALNRPTHTLYSICMVVQPTAQEWTVNRRYSQFLQLKKDLLHELHTRGNCPGCMSFARAVQKFPFPHKAFLRTNKVVRKRVTSLQEFLKLLVERIYNDLPKCATCGDRIKKIIRPFLLRGAQPLGGSTPARIQQSLSLASYAVIARPVHPANAAYPVKKNQQQPPSNHSYSSTQGTNSDPSLDLSSPTDVSSTDPPQLEEDVVESSSESSYAHEYGDERCRDPAVPLQEAIKEVVMADGLATTYEDVVFRLSTMWDAFDKVDLTELQNPENDTTIR